MASKPKSRWADTEEDAELDAKLRREKEEKRRRKAEKAQRLNQERQAAATSSSSQQQQQDDGGDDGSTLRQGGPPSKRRKLTPEPNDATAAPAKLLRFSTTPSGWAQSRSVENYDKLNDIEEGTYGWVARATQRSTGKIVALKRLKLEPGDRNGLPVTGLREMQILQDCKHRNIVAMEEVVVGGDATKLDK